jgi:hypothetical protein
MTYTDALGRNREGAALLATAISQSSESEESGLSTAVAGSAAIVSRSIQ